jgi:hypothetical protein
MSAARSFLHEIHSASVPFVYRVFRGNRLRRYALVSVALALLSVLLGTWLAFGNGELEREIRTELDLEVSTWEREHSTYTDISDDAAEYERAVEDRQRLISSGLDPSAPYYGSLGHLVENAKWELYAATKHAYLLPPEHEALRERAQLLLDRYPVLTGTDYGTDFQWRDPDSVRRLQAIVDAQLVPHVELYASPLSLRDGIGVIGLIAGGLGMLLLLVGAPLFAGAQIAQEAHENTLQPLLGTRITPRGLVVGLTAGPFAAAGLFAAPQLLVYAIAGLLAGHAVAVPGFILLTIATAVLLTMVVQLLGYGMGRRWASGLVGTTLTVLLVVSMMIATGIALNIDDESAGLVTILPQTGCVHLLVETFIPQARLHGSDALLLDLRLVFAGIAFAILGVIAVRALERRVTARTQASLLPGEALVAALVLIGMALSAVPEFRPREFIPTYFISLALVVIPLLVLVMSRVPMGDGPAKLRKIPLRRVLAELGVWLAIHAALVLTIGGGDVPLSVGGAFYLLWALGVAALCAVRVAATPLKPLGAIFVCFALFTAAVGYGLAGAFFAAADEGHDIFFGLFEVSAVLGVLQLLVTVGVPWSLARSLQRESAGLE